MTKKVVMIILVMRNKVMRNKVVVMKVIMGMEVMICRKVMMIMMVGMVLRRR